jgi:NDP-sugar pyrophosphorylase family protein
MAALAITPARNDDDAPLWVRLDPGGRVAALGETAASSGWATGGIYAFSAVARARAAQALASGMHRMRIFLGDLVASGADVRAIEVDRIIDIDHRNDLERANAYMTRFGSARTVSEQP